MESVTRGPATPEDTAFARRVHHEANRDVVVRQFGVWDEAAQDRFFEVDWQPGIYEIVLLDGEPCGYVCVDARADDVYVRNIHVLPAFQGRGVGTQLLREAIARADARGVPTRLQTLHLNRAANLYRRLGFVEVGRTGTHILFERPVP